jgi:hypothetical protein
MKRAAWGRLSLLVVALLLAAHSAAHFLAAARIVRSMGLGPPVELFGGLVATSNWAVEMVLAILLAAAGTGFLIAARLLVGREPAVGPLLMVVAGLSLVLTVVGLWATIGGVLVNVAVLTVLPGTARLMNAQRPAPSVFF